MDGRVDTAPRIADLSGHAAWLREIDAALLSAPQMVLTGNVHDLQLPPDGEDGPMTPVVGAVTRLLSRAGFPAVLHLEPVGGASVLHDGDGAGAAVLRAADAAGRAVPEGRTKVAADMMVGVLRAAQEAEQPCAVIVEGVGRLAVGGDAGGEDLHRTMVVAESLLARARARRVPGPHLAPLYNTVIWIVDRLNDLPPWFVGRDAVSTISVPTPTLAHRTKAARQVAPLVPGAVELDQAGLESAAVRLAEATDGLTLRALLEIGRLCVDQGIDVARLEDGVRMYRVGIPENPWTDPDLVERIQTAHETLSRNVKGQAHAVRQTLDILIRSTSGLSGAQARSSGNRPQGVLFFAGPTGVGKTELAKSIAELVFGHPDAVVRFDMSEFAAEHTEARLIGAPPGYTGHDAGGELTNAVRERPFSLLLFDEIDKAHPRILDKFLQILEDGRLTDANGSTVYFSESIIVFTSNLGIYDVAADGTRVPVVRPGEPFGVVEERVQASVRRHFTERLGRPEILNRIGDNVVVFDFISADVVAQLVPMFLENVGERIRQSRGADVVFSADVVAALVEAGRARLDFGGRGVATAVETMLVNPLARALVGLPKGQRSIHVAQITKEADGWRVDLA